MKFISKSVRNRLQASLFAILLLSMAGCYLSYDMLKSVVAHEQTKSSVDNLVRQLAELRNHERNFLLWGRKDERFYLKNNTPELEAHLQVRNQLEEQLITLENQPLMQDGELRQEITQIKLAFQQYNKVFADLVSAYQKRGFKDWGLEGEMRTYIHGIEKAKSKEEQWYVLMLRRHEKDFFMRQEPKYALQVNTRADEFIHFVQNSSAPHITAAYQGQMIEAIEAYRKHFNTIADIEEKIGLNNQAGLLGQLQDHISSVDPLAAGLQKKITLKSEALIDRSLWTMVACGIILLIFSLLISLLLARSIAKPLKLLSTIMEHVRSGGIEAMKQLQGVKRYDEIGSLIFNFQMLIEDIQAKVIEIQSQNRVLQEASAKEMEGRWLSEGSARFERLLMEKQSDLNELSDTFLKELVKYIGASQGALFILSEEQDVPVMVLSSCYASDKKRHQRASFALGEGLVGAVWQEQEPVYMNDIPSDYSKIRSGLGMAKPKSILIVPVISNGNVEGILELGAFHEFTPAQQELVLQLTKALATSLSTAKMKETTQVLLRQAQKMAAELRENEEEMRQNIEEMQASQEEMRRKQQQSLQFTHQLQNTLGVMEQFMHQWCECFMVCDETGKVVYADHEIVKMFHVLPSELIGTPIESSLKLPLKNWLADLLLDPQFVASGRTEDKTVKLQTPFGSEMELRVSVAAVKVEDKQYYLLLYKGEIEIAKAPPLKQLAEPLVCC